MSMSDSPKYTYVNADDWCGLYRDGELILGGHSIPTFEWLTLLGVPESDRLSWEDNAGIDQMFEETGGCPNTWDEVLEWAKK